MTILRHLPNAVSKLHKNIFPVLGNGSYIIDKKENIYLDLLEEPYNPLLTRERKQEDLKDMEAYGKYVSRVKVGGRKRTLRKRIKLQ